MVDKGNDIVFLVMKIGASLLNSNANLFRINKHRKHAVFIRRLKRAL